MCIVGASYGWETFKTYYVNNEAGVYQQKFIAKMLEEWIKYLNSIIVDCWNLQSGSLKIQNASFIPISDVTTYEFK